MFVPVACIGVFLASLGLTAMLRRYALAKNLVDTPNARSSHQAPTARGGGLAFVLVILCVIIAFALSNRMSPLWASGLVIAGTGLAAIGWIDDKGHVAARSRLAVHIGAASLLTYAIGPVSLAAIGIDYAPLDWIVTIGAIVWMINLVNFMDGIDGIAGSEAVFVCAALACSFAFASYWNASATFALLMAAAILGFLVLNWPPASIFMGDVGSGFLGGMLAALVLMANREGWPFAAATLISLSVFLCDASVTLARRSLRRQVVWQAHRSHAYQRLARRWQSHAKVTHAVLVVNILYLLPLSIAVAAGNLEPLVGIALAWTPLVGVAIFAGAGLPDEV